MQVEIHITTSGLDAVEVDRFIHFCDTIDAKPIVIELSGGEVLQHPMISKRVDVKDRSELDAIVSGLKNSFTEAGYILSRVKLEVHSKYAEAGRLLFLDFTGGYYEWHGKIYSDNLEEVYGFARVMNVHVSKNGLKGIENRRILTIRETRDERIFLNRISSIKSYFERNGIAIVNEEQEYCIYDSNKSLDRGWIDTPEITDQQYLDLLSFEAFLRRAATLDLPFMLKGSILTRQFYANKGDRIVRDIDYLYFGEAKDDVAFMSAELSDWVEEVTAVSCGDNVTYRKFSENKFWRAIDYAMSDDFPTTNTDLYCTVKGTANPAISLDVSWGLPLNLPPASIIYHPLEGSPFEIRYTAPISLQLSWKLHQSIVRPRLKDLIDINYLLREVDISDKEIEIAAIEFLRECRKDGVDARRVLYLIDGTIRHFVNRDEDISSRSMRSPLLHVGELDRENIEYLKHIFPNYKSKYSTVTDILLEFESVMSNNNFGDFIANNFDKSY